MEWLGRAGVELVRCVLFSPLARKTLVLPTICVTDFTVLFSSFLVFSCAWGGGRGRSILACPDLVLSGVRCCALICPLLCKHKINAGVPRPCLNICLLISVFLRELAYNKYELRADVGVQQLVVVDGAPVSPAGVLGWCSRAWSTE